MTDTPDTQQRPMHAVVKTADGFTAHAGLLEECARPECVAAATLAAERAAHEEHRRQLAAALGADATTADWPYLLGRATEIRDGRDRADTECTRLAGEAEEHQRQLAEARAAQARYEEETVGRFNKQATEDRRRAEQAEATVRDYENRITWETTCGEHARLLDSCRVADEARERAEAALTRVRELRAQADREDPASWGPTWAALNAALDGDRLAEVPCTHRCGCGHDQQDHTTSGYCNACGVSDCPNDGHYPSDCPKEIHR
ncbi:hypothetical protein RVR_8290 [Actinacidiphila reveromycinica]|uniref:Uncharacterized protein n=1 Tax=Actinacidiphila reveromycinica TaxID=659352 RepID=A0A7U3VRP1_9ACTN|nr:hypothetical protein [Streptomyces sp. SN-593]BBB01053.1 hypothetical protein RVR_8290 [Streptomyces sp. SN-593]